MTRQGSNEYNAEGILVNGYDYDLQCWVKGSIVQNCGHPAGDNCGCYGREHRGQPIENARSAAGLPLRDRVQDEQQQLTVISNDAGRGGVTPGRMTCSNGATVPDEITGKHYKLREPMRPARSRRDRKRRAGKLEDAMKAIARAQGRADAKNYKPYDRALAIVAELEELFELRRKPNK